MPVAHALPSGVSPRAFMNSASFAGYVYVGGGCAGVDCVQHGSSDDLYGDVWMSESEGEYAGEHWAWQESTASFGMRSGAASLLSGRTWLLVGGVSRGLVHADVYRAELPIGNPNSDGGVVGGILGCATGIIIVCLMIRHLFISQSEKGEKKLRMQLDAMAREQSGGAVAAAQQDQAHDDKPAH